MHLSVIDFHGHRFVRLAAEGRPDLAAEPAMRELVERCAGALTEVGLSLGDTVRTRLWARTAADRTAASTARRALLDGPARSSSSSYIAPGRFACGAAVALDLLAIEPVHRGSAKVAVEYDPPASPPRYVLYDGLLFCSGVCPRVPTLEEAVRDALREHTQSLELAGMRWGNVVEIAAYANRRYDLPQIRDLLHAELPAHGIPATYVLVDGHAGPDAHIEIELTARRA